MIKTYYNFQWVSVIYFKLVFISCSTIIEGKQITGLLEVVGFGDEALGGVDLGAEEDGDTAAGETLGGRTLGKEVSLSQTTVKFYLCLKVSSREYFGPVNMKKKG